MTQVELMFALRHRLKLVTERWEYARAYQYAIEQEPYDHQREVEHWMKQGAESELRSEMEFLQSVIGDLEKGGGVTGEWSAMAAHLLK
jgi:hypothetical protein